MCELLWSDPQAEPGRSPSKRGVGVAFGEDLVAMHHAHVAAEVDDRFASCRARLDNAHA